MNILQNVKIRKRFTDFNLLMRKKQLLDKRRLEMLKFTNEKQSSRLRS